MRKSISKIVVYALVLCLIVPCMFMLTACNTGHTHVLSKTDAKDATCTTAGNTAYYHCSDCDKYYSDNNAEIEIAKNSWVVPATGNHIYINGVCACGYTCTVTSAQWDTILSTGLNNVTCTRENWSNGVVKTEISKYTEGAQYDSEGYVNREQGVYFEKRENIWYEILMTENVWYGTDTVQDIVDSFSVPKELAKYVGQYSAFTYSETHECYELDTYTAEKTTHIQIYFENGKLVKSSRVEITDSTSRAVIDTFSNHGTTTIDVPTWTLQS